MKRAAPWLALAVVVGATVAFVAWPRGAPSDASRARALAEEIRCPECQGLSAGDSSAATARAIRADIRDRVASGQSDAEIREAMVERYGESILLRPEDDGLGLVVWGLPVAALVLGAGGLAVALRRWRAEPRLTPTDADRTLVERARP